MAAAAVTSCLHYHSLTLISALPLALDVQLSSGSLSTSKLCVLKTLVQQCAIVQGHMCRAGLIVWQECSVASQINSIFICRPEFLKEFDVAGTIHDYVVSMLCASKGCSISAQNAASWGYFNTVTNRWNVDM